MNNTQISPKFSLNEKVVYRVQTSPNTFYDLRCTVLQIFQSELAGSIPFYKLSGLLDYLNSDIKPEFKIRSDRAVKLK